MMLDPSMIEPANVEWGFINALIGGGISLIGGLFGKKKDKPQVTTTSHEVDLGRLTREAIAAGYNPRTILNAGGLSAYTTTTGTATGGPGSGGTSAIGHIANAAGAAFNIFREDAASKAVMSSSFPSAPSQPMSRAMGWSSLPGGSAAARTSVPTIRASGMMSRLTSSQALGGNDVVKPELGGQVKPTYEAPTITNPNAIGGGLVDPSLVDAEMVETRKGDSWMNWPYYARVHFADAWYNATGETNRQMGQRMTREMAGNRSMAEGIVGLVVKYGLPALGFGKPYKKEADAVVDPFGGPNSVRSW